jgi:hypothetical protein
MMFHMSIDTGWQMRLDILRRDAQRKFLDPLHTHGWKATIEQAVERGEYLLISAERGGKRHVVALMYSSATDNAVYKSLAQEVGHIFFNGAPYMVESFAHGITVPVSAADDFHALLLNWNAASSDGKFAPGAENAEIVPVTRPQHRVLLSEDPIQAIWFRLRQIQSVNLAKKLIIERALLERVNLTDDAVHSKAEGVAYALRNASDYFQAREVRNVSQRVLNLYYGSLAFAFAEMLATPNGPMTLVEIEDSTKQGHGLYTVDGLSKGLEHLIVGVISRGFFPAWMKFLGLETDQIPEKKAAHYDKIKGLPHTSWLTVERLFACIPEVSDLFNDIFESPPAWVTPVYDQSANAGPTLFVNKKRASRSYVLFVDESRRLTKEDIAVFPGPISEIVEVASEHSGRQFRVAIDHADKDTWWEALRVHHSPFKRDALILPIFGVVDEFRVICGVALCALDCRSLSSRHLAACPRR